MAQDDFEAIVVGGGPAGLTAARVLADAGRRVALVDPSPAARPPSGRTTAVMRPQAELLRRLQAWPASAEEAPLRGLRMVNHAPVGGATEVLFVAEDLGVDCFAWNVANRDLVAALHARAEGDISLIAGRTSELFRRAGRWRVTLEDGRVLQTTLVVGADGKNSGVRRALRIGARRHDYHQIANTARLAIEGEHDNVSTEVHKPGGPFTTVPAGPHALSLVWLESAAEGRRLAELDDADFIAAVEAADGGRHGRVTSVEGRAAVPITGLLAHRLTGPGGLLLGEAAHAVSPLGAQGFNLTLRDCAALAELAAHPRFASADALKAYEHARLAETRMYFWFIDALNRAVLRPEAAVGVVRGLGLRAVDALGPVRRELMERLMQPRPLSLTRVPA